MTKQEAMEKAKLAVNVPAGAKTTVYEIPFESMESAKGLVDKTITGPNGKSFEVIAWVKQSYVVRIGDQYHTQPVMYILSNLSKFTVS